MIRRRLFRNLPVTMTQALIGFGSLAVFTRLMPPEVFGHYALALSAAMLAHTLALTWAEAAAFRFAGGLRTRSDQANHFATLLGLALAAGALAGLIAAIALFNLGPNPDNGLLIAFCAGSASLRCLTKLARESDRAAMADGRFALRECAYLMGGFVLGTGCVVLFELGPAAPFLGTLLAGVMVGMMDLPALNRAARGGQFEPQRAAIYFTYGMPLALSMALELAMQTVLRALLAQIVGPEAVGAYAAAIGLARPLDIVFLWAAMAGGPMLLRAYESGGVAGVKGAAKTYARTLIGLSLPAAVGLALVAEPLAEVLVGPALAPAAAALLPLTALSFLLTGWVTHFFSEAFQLSRRTLTRGLLMVVPACLACLMAPLAIISFGVPGAAAAAVGAAGLSMALLAAIGRELVPLPVPGTDLARAALSCALMALAVVACPTPGGGAELGLKALVGALTYGAAMVALAPAGAPWSALALWRRVSVRLLSKSQAVDP